MVVPIAISLGEILTQLMHQRFMIVMATTEASGALTPMTPIQPQTLMGGTAVGIPHDLPP